MQQYSEQILWLCESTTINWQNLNQMVFWNLLWQLHLSCDKLAALSTIFLPI